MSVTVVSIRFLSNVSSRDLRVAKVSSVKSAEDAETNKKTGGDNVSQDQAQTMFENVGQKSMGIDVSHHQGKIDWAKVKASGVEFAIIRAGYRGQTSGGIYEDAYFKTNHGASWLSSKS